MTTDERPPFRHVAIVGVGLIGGSIALGLRASWPGIRITGVDRPAVLAHATGAGAVDRTAASVGDLAEDVDLVVLAAPVRQNQRLLAEMSPIRPGRIVSDVGSTKRDIVRASTALGVSAQFVGGHPIGGAERGGFGFARPDLFKGRPWILTPEPLSDADAVHRLEVLVRGLGARPTSLPAAEHDRLMAYLSHLPQLAASALMDAVGTSAQAEGLRLAGRGLQDTTRLASSPPDVWRDITQSNADVLREALDRLIERLSDLRADLDRGESLTAIFESAARWRAEMMRGE